MLLRLSLIVVLLGTLPPPRHVEAKESPQSRDRGSSLRTEAEDRETQLLREMWSYTPELPRPLLAQSVGMQGDRTRLEGFIAKLIAGQPVKISLLGGSLSLRGWNFPDENYLRLLHKWLEVTFVEGCREEAQARATAEAAAPAPKRWKGKRRDDAVAPAATPAADGSEGDDVAPSDEDAATAASRHATASATAKGRPAATDSALPSELAATLPSEEGEWIPERGPSPPTDLHHLPSAGYRATGHACGRSRIELVNLAVPAAGPGYAERCVLQRLPKDSDLVLLDFGINDFQKADRLSHPERQAFERIMRRALSLPKSPAVVLFEAYSAFQAKNSFIGVGPNKRENLSQDKHMLIGEYYGEVQAISARAALWQLIVGAEDTGDPNMLVFLGRHFLNDMIHVTPFGHRWYADLLISYLRDVASDMLTRKITARLMGQKLPDAARAAWSRSLQPPAPPSRPLRPAAAASSEPGGAATTTCWGGTRVATGNCSVAGSLGRSYHVRSSSSGLKLPLFQDNEYEDAGVCAVGGEFEALVAERDGWQWADDGKPGRPKWGFVSEGVGQRLVIGVDISKHVVGMPGGAAAAAAAGGKNLEHEARIRDRYVNAFLIYLSSWKDMGSAKVECSGACNCTPSTVDAMSKEQRFRASIPMVHEFQMTPTDPATAGRGQEQDDGDGSEQRKCLVSVEILQASSSSGHRFKVMGLTTSTHKLFHIDYIVSKSADRTIS